MLQEVQKTRFTAGPLTFSVKHELWDGNIQDHPDQGVAIAVAADVAGKETTLLRFNCFDFEKSYIYGPENPDLEVAGPEMLGGAMLTNLYRMDPIADGNPIGWTIKTLGTKLPKMLERAGYPQIAAKTNLAAVKRILPDLEASARELYAVKRNTVKHNRGTHIFEAGNIRFGLEMRRLPMGDGGLAIHVLADIGGTPGKHYTEETELLAFDHFWNGRALPLRPAQQEPPHLLGPDPGRRPAGVDAGAVRDRQAAGDDRARRLSRDRGRSRRGKNRRRLSGDEEAGTRDVGGRREVDRSPGAAVGADPEHGRRRVGRTRQRARERSVALTGRGSTGSLVEPRRHFDHEGAGSTCSLFFCPR